MVVVFGDGETFKSFPTELSEEEALKSEKSFLQLQLRAEEEQGYKSVDERISKLKLKIIEVEDKLKSL